MVILFGRELKRRVTTLKDAAALLVYSEILSGPVWLEEPRANAEYTTPGSDSPQLPGAGEYRSA